MNSEIGRVTIKEDELVFEVDSDIYPISAVQKTLYWFTDRCFVFLERRTHDRLAIRIRAKKDGVDLETTKDEFCNALLDQSLRERVSTETEPLRNLILAHALSKTNLIDPQFDEAEPAVDPAGISSPDLLSSDEVS